MKTQNTVTIDSIFKELGPFGRYNVINYVLLLLPTYLGSMYISVYNFEAMDISYRCEVLQCENQSISQWLEHAIPFEKGELSKCSLYKYNNVSNDDICSDKAFNKSVTIDCDGYVYSDEDSIVKDFDLGCQNWKRTMIGTIHNAGLFIALPLTGLISDRFGRKVAMPISSVINGIFGIARSFSTSYTMMIILEFGEAALGGGAYSTSFVLAMELVRPQGRVLGNMIINLVYVLGLTTLASLAWWLQNWRHLLRIIYTPSFFVLSYVIVLNESPRWLFSKGRYQEGIDILKRAANINKVVIAEDKLKLENFMKKNIENSGSERDANNGSVFLMIIKSRTLIRRLAISCYMWITCSFVYYGLAINSVSLAGNKYLNFILVALVEIPANIICLLILDKFGRKRVILTSFILCGCIFISLSVLPKDTCFYDYPSCALILYLCGKCFITIAYISVYIYVSELIPTTARQSLMAVCSAIGKVGSVIAPLTPLLALHYVNLPAVLFGSLPLLASMLVCFLPETVDTTLPDTFQEAEAIS